MDTYGEMFAAQAGSTTLREIWRAAYQEDYPENADPLSFVTQTDLNWIVDTVELTAGTDLVDLACGAGGPGAYVAHTTGARLTGIDASAGAVEIARRRHTNGLDAGSRFENHPFEDTCLPDCFADAVMSTDALFYATSQSTLFDEVARIGKPGSRLAFTSFELRSHSRALNAGPVLDYRRSLEAAGFEIERYEEAPDWESRMRAVFSGILANREELQQELGEVLANLMITWAQFRPQELSDSRRVLVAARRR